MKKKFDDRHLPDVWNKVWADPNPKNYSVLRLFKTQDKIKFLTSMGLEFKGKKVLDIGCGDGTALFYLQEQYGITGVGVDISDVVIEKNKAKEAMYPGLKFIRGDHKFLDFPNEEFDIVLSWGVVEHLREYLYALAEVRRVLKNDGTLVLIQPNSWSFGVLQEMILRFSGKWRFGEQKNFSHRYLRQTLEAIGYYDLIVTARAPYKDMAITMVFDLFFKIFIKYWGHYLYVIARKKNLEVAYRQSFELFLSRTDEKKVIREMLAQVVDIRAVHSCMDIGGGNGLLSAAICDKGSMLIIEPNKNFVDNLRAQGFRCICAKWENVDLEERFDLVLAAYSVTHLPQKHLHALISKMVRHLNVGGKLVVLAVDEKEGSWRAVHTYFYNLIGLKKQSSTVKLKKIMGQINAQEVKFTTKVFADDVEQMLQILTFDLCRFGEKFELNKDALRRHLTQFTKDGKIALEMVHWMFVVKKEI